MGTVRSERSISEHRLTNTQDDQVAMHVIPSNDETYVISDDESDFTVRTPNCSTSRTSMRTTRAAQQNEDMTKSATTCDVCRYCINDVCNLPHCMDCEPKKSNAYNNRSCGAYEQQRVYTPCQIRRHNHVNSAWIVAGDVVYDVTSYVQHHPGGSQCILKKAGGQRDCMRDLQFHSSRGRQLFQQYAIGKVVPCPGCSTTTAITATSTGCRPTTGIKSERQHKWFLW